MTVLTLGSAMFFSFRQDPVYRSTARVLVKPLNPNQALGFNYNFLISMGTEAALAQSPAVGTQAATIVEAGGGSPVETGTVSVGNPPDTTFLDITYSDGDPAIAQQWAAAYAQGYIANRELQALAAYEAAASGYDQTIADLQAEISAKRQELLDALLVQERRLIRRELETMQQQLTVVQAQRAQLPIPSEDAAQVVDPADLPSAPSSPNHLQNAILALMAGLALGVGVGFAKERMDDRLGGREDLESQIGAPTFAIIPSVRGWRRRRATYLVAKEEPTSPTSEAYRTIRANLEFAAREGDLKIVTLTSPSLGEGKTTTTASLAVTLAAAGKRVIAISCDLRKPRLHEFFGLDNRVGLTDVLTGGAALHDVAQRWEMDSLRVVASGPVPGNPAELLGSEAMTTLLAQIRRYADFVLLDTPPVLAVSDALLVAPRSDGTLIIADAGRTTRSTVGHTRAQLEQVGATILGGVLNNLDPNRARYYPSYVRKYYGHAYADAIPAPSAEANGSSRDRPMTPEELWR